MITANGITVNATAEAVPTPRGDDYIVTASQALTDAQLAALLANDWEPEGSDTVAGMDTLISVRYRFTRSKTALDKAREALAIKDQELAQALQDAINGLVSAPAAGEAWDSAKWYRQGDTVVYEGVGYTCATTCKGREPEMGGYWEVTPVQPEEIPVWGDMVSGATIPVGQLVTHNDATWRCVKAHTKSVILQPSPVQTEYWEAVP